MELKIDLSTVNKIKNFVGITTSFDCDFDIVSGRYIIDGKSIMGIFSLDISRPILLKVHALDDIQAEKIKEALKDYIV